MTPYASGEPDPTRPPAAQVSAAIALLDRAWGRPHQALEVAISRASLEDMSNAELLSIANGADGPHRPMVLKKVSRLGANGDSVCLRVSAAAERSGSLCSVGVELGQSSKASKSPDPSV
jgi:hypothetical protein